MGVVQFAFLPHYQSDHEESELIDKEVERCMENNWKFKTLKDGEVLIFENVETLQKLSLS
ncbi:hypothetical protein [Chryseobacterium sp.]|uniref:hypothetical protein n=1 Tax=Chryseobacterium sp. TaxID=1871047 RepID=UPI00388FF405